MCVRERSNNNTEMNTLHTHTSSTHADSQFIGSWRGRSVIKRRRGERGRAFNQRKGDACN